MKEQLQQEAQRWAAREWQAELAQVRAQASWQESWQQFCWQRQREEEEREAHEAEAEARAQKAAAQQAAAAVARAAEAAKAAELMQQQQMEAAVAMEEAGRARVTARGGPVCAASSCAAVSTPGKRQRVGAEGVDLEQMEQSASAPMPASAAAGGRAPGAQSTRARAPRAPTKRSAAKPPPRVRVVKPPAVGRQRGRQALPSRAERAAWPAMRDAAVRAGLDFMACQSCGEPAYEGVRCGRGGEYCEHNDRMDSDDDGVLYESIVLEGDEI